MKHLFFVCCVLSLSLVFAIDFRNQDELAQLLKEKTEAKENLTPLFTQQNSDHFKRGVSVEFNLTSGVAAQPNTSSVGYYFFAQEGVPVFLELSSTSNNTLTFYIYSADIDNFQYLTILPGQNYTEELSSACSLYYFIISNPGTDYQSVTIKATNRPGVNALTIGGAAKYNELPENTIYTYYIDIVQRCSNFTIVAVPENGTNQIQYFQSFVCPAGTSCSFTQPSLETGAVASVDLQCMSTGRYWFGIATIGSTAVNYTIQVIPRNCPPCVNNQGGCEYQHPNYVCSCNPYFAGTNCQNTDNSTIQAPVNNYELTTSVSTVFYFQFGTIVTENVIINVSSDVPMQNVNFDIFHADQIAYLSSNGAENSFTWEIASPLVSNRIVFVRVISYTFPYNISVTYSLVPRTVSSLPALYSVSNPSDFQMYRVPNPPPVLVATLRIPNRDSFGSFAGVAIVKSDGLTYDRGNSQSWNTDLPNYDLSFYAVLFQAVFKCNENLDALYVGVSVHFNSSFDLTIGPPVNCTNGCSNQGYCNAFGNCECFEPFSGADCSVGATQINFNTIVSGNASSDLLFFADRTTHDQIGLISYLPSALTLSTFERNEFNDIYTIYSADSFYLCYSNTQLGRYYVKVPANQAYSFKLVALNAIELNGISTFNLTFDSPILIKATTTASTQVNIELTSNDTFTVQNPCNESPRTLNSWSYLYEICEPSTQYIVLSVPFGQTAQVTVNVTYSTPPQCPNCCGGAGNCDSQTYTCGGCPSLYVTGNDCSTPVCNDAANLLFCPSSTPRSLSLFFSGVGGGSCTLKELDAFLNFVISEQFGASSTDCRNYVPEVFCDLYFPRCSGSSLITSCSDKCDFFNSLCVPCGSSFEECQDFRSPYLNYTCAPLFSTTGSVTTGSRTSGVLTSGSVTTGTNTGGSTSTSGDSGTSSGDESSSTFLVPSFLIVLLTIIYA